MKSVNILILALLALSGCVNLGLDGGSNAPDIVHYVLEDGGRAAPTQVQPQARVLVLADVQSGAFYDTDGMAFSRQAGTRGHYQFARWTERPGKRFTDLLLARVEQERIFAAIAQPGSNVRGDWLLTAEIVEFYHDAAQQPGTVKMELRAEVVDLKSRSVVARRHFSQAGAAPSFDAAGAHKAFNDAATRTLNDMADWLRGLSARN